MELETLISSSIFRMRLVITGYFDNRNCFDLSMREIAIAIIAIAVTEEKAQP